MLSKFGPERSAFLVLSPFKKNTLLIITYAVLSESQHVLEAQ